MNTFEKLAKPFIKFGLLRNRLGLVRPKLRGLYIKLAAFGYKKGNALAELPSTLAAAAAMAAFELSELLPLLAANDEPVLDLIPPLDLSSLTPLAAFKPEAEARLANAAKSRLEAPASFLFDVC